MVHSNSLSFFSSQSVRKLNKEHCGRSIDQVDDGFVHCDRQIRRVANKRVQFQDDGALVDFTNLLVDVNV